MMTRRYEHGDDNSHYARNARSLPLTMSRSNREPARTYPMSGHSNPVALSRDNDNQGEKQRRRIAVACSRCRKRKIKCSGDSGNGQGCLNCKNAGTEPSQCQFLRVSSNNCDFTPEWPYLASAPPVGVPSVPVFYSSPSYSMPSLGSSSFPGAPRSRYANGSYPYQAISSSQDLYGTYQIASAGDATLYEPQYGFPAPGQQTYLASQDHQAQSASMRQWQSPATTSRPYNPPYDPEITGSRYPQPSLNYSGITDAPVSTIDGAPLVPSMGALNISQTSSSLVDGRILPTPRGGSIAPSDMTPLATFPDPTSTDQSGKSIGSWSSVSDRTTSGSASQGSTSTAPSKTDSLKGRRSRKSSSASPPEVSETAFTYSSAPASQNSSSGSEVAVSDFNLAPTTMTAGVIDGQMMYHPVAGSENREMRVPSNSYHYSMGSSSKRGSLSSSESTLLSGQAYQPYHQLRQSTSQQEQQPNLNESLRHDAARTPVAAQGR